MMHVTKGRCGAANARTGIASTPLWRTTIKHSFLYPAAAFVLLLFSCAASAELLFAISNSWEGGGAFIPYSNSLYFAFGNFNLRPSSGNDLFWLTNAIYDTYAFTTNDVGKEFPLTAAEDPDFTILASNLVNGLPERIGWVTAYTPIHPDYSGTHNYEAVILAGSPFLTNGIDLQGTVIDRFVLRIDDLYLDIPGWDPNGDGNWTDLRFSVTLFIEGHVIPEPSTVLLFMLGGALVFMFKRK